MYQKSRKCNVYVTIIPDIRENLTLININNELIGGKGLCFSRVKNENSYILNYIR